MFFYKGWHSLMILVYGFTMFHMGLSENGDAGDARKVTFLPGELRQARYWILDVSMHCRRAEPQLGVTPKFHERRTSLGGSPCGGTEVCTGPCG